MMACRMIVIAWAIFLMAAAVPANAAELVIVASSAPNLSPGQIIKTGAVIQVPAGTSVTLVSQTGKLLTLKGPHAGPPGLSRQGSGNGRLVSSLSNLLLGSGKEMTSLGAVRAGRLPLPPSAPWAINVHRSGHYCFQAASSAKLWRQEIELSWIFSLKNLVDKTKSTVDWPAGSNTLDWPLKVTLSDGATYMVRQKNSRTSRRLVLHRVPSDLPSDAHKAVWMAEKGCLDQAKRLLARMR